MSSNNNQYEDLTSPLNYQEQLRRQTIINSMENKDYLLIIASQQNKSVQQVKHELKLKLVNEG
ncbi:uncharacterized protein SPAPADRAFT_141621 [Spathaspora passalidarum NRRL Y-27907]|uniref:Uncharacterized protein n=1 Tax=Spathaspora passalidarum (strain NRRL Y-27907 / 11-Y1) TaxID=619300 RepID=G3ATN0_SPAPN|nr:uncharacterized protein SPAPADRAFT_141621 [Spathaspora passalidarum NRRL Y-27907]EGW30994.1 hypothetical protein SPAPADRAFT_141621 [Spathaspora passalidarum NRRL Y-27907]